MYDRSIETIVNIVVHLHVLYPDRVVSLHHDSFAVQTTIDKFFPVVQ